MKTSFKLIISLSALTLVSAQAQDVIDCEPITAAVTASVEADKSEVLNVVSERVGQAPKCACEIVKAAIVAADANKSLVGQIVEAAINAAPEQAGLIAQCATSEAPDAVAQINEAVANSGATTPPGGQNPLDFPGDVAGGGGVQGGDNSSGGGTGTAGDGTDNNLPVNQDPGSVTNPNP